LHAWKNCCCTTCPPSSYPRVLLSNDCSEIVGGTQIPRPVCVFCISFF
jgi:hypothetical protein